MRHRRGSLVDVALVGLDPSIIQVDGVWYSFATRTIGSTIKIQVAGSYDFAVWGLFYYQDGTQYDALPNLPPWVKNPNWNTWAPDVQQLVGEPGQKAESMNAKNAGLGRRIIHHVL